MERVVVDLYVVVAQAALFVGESTEEQRLDVVDGERLELEDLAAADQGAVDGEKGIAGGRADERDDAFFDVGKERVLLAFVETVDFVDKEQRALAAAGQIVAGLPEDVAEVFDAAGDGRELLEFFLAFGGEQAGERGFSGAGGAVKDYGAQSVGGEEAAEQLARPEKMLLAGEFGERAGAHAGGQRLGGLEVVGFGFFKERGHELLCNRLGISVAGNGCDAYFVMGYDESRSGDVSSGRVFGGKCRPARHIGPAVPFLILLVGIGVVAFAAALAWWTLEPINRVAGQLRFSTRFMLTDFLGLMILLQGPLAVIGRAIDSDSNESATYWLILSIILFLVVVLWMASVSVVSRAGITRLWRRLCVMVVCVPGTLGLIIAWPLTGAAAVYWVQLAPDHLPTYGLIALLLLGLVVLTWMTRRLAFWTLVGSPGEAILGTLKRGQLTAQ